MKQGQRAKPRDERGIAMMTTIMIIAIMAALTTIIVMNGQHNDRMSGRNENWTATIHVAEAGVQQAIVRLQASGGVVVPKFTGTTSDGGSYTVKMTALGRNKYQIDSLGSEGTTTAMKTERGLRVIYGPQPSFKYALFSLSDVNTKNNDYVQGDIWANGSVVVDQNDEVNGYVNAATGYVFLDNGSKVDKDVWSGGYDASNNAVTVSTNAKVLGSVKASSTVPACTNDPGNAAYKISTVGTIAGNVTTWGDITNPSNVSGIKTTHVCTAAPATKPIPVFHYNPVNYTPPATTYPSVAAFQTYLSSHTSGLSGTFYVQGAGTVDLTGVTIGADTAIIAESASINSDGISAANNSDKILVLVSYYAPPANTSCPGNGGNPTVYCAIGLKNNFQPSDNTATLLYAPNGPISFKNSAQFTGAVYAQNIVTKNNQNLVYDPRVEQIVGFGTATLVQTSWQELPKSKLVLN